MADKHASEAVIPTMTFRWWTDSIHKTPILQQLCHLAVGGSYWRTIPTVYDVSEAS